MNSPILTRITARGFRAYTVLTTIAISAMLLFAGCGVPDTADVRAQNTEQVQKPTVEPQAAPSNGLPVGTFIRNMRLIGEKRGWVLTDRGVWWTNDSTRNWKKQLLAMQVQPEDIGETFFLDEQHGWSVLRQLRPNATNPIDFIVQRTTDGGQSWLNSSLYPDYTGYTEEPGGTFSMTFIDPQHGWVMVRSLTGAVVDSGTLFRTTDGGATWSRVAAPSGQPVRFINALDGWTTNVPMAKLYITHDGGATWEEQVLSGISQPNTSRVAEDVTPPIDPNVTTPTYELPTFFNATDGILAVTLIGEQASVQFYTTRDGGRSWNLASTIATSIPKSLGATVPTAAITRNEWIVLLSDSKIQRTTNAGANWQEENTPGLPPGLARLAFVSNLYGWAESSVGQCAQYKTQCSVKTQLLITENGGRAWRPILTFVRPDG